MKSVLKDQDGNDKNSLLAKSLRIILGQWLLIGMGVACLLAYYFPSVASTGGTIRAEYTILYGAVAIVFLVSGLSIPRDKLVLHVRNWRLHFLVQGVSYLFIPALMQALVQWIHAADPTGDRIDTAILAGYILLSCLPTTISSNVVMTRTAGGDDAAALVEVLVANIMGPFVTPGWTITLLPNSDMFDPWRDATGGGNLTDMYKDVFQELGLTVLLPLVVGQVIRWTFPDRTAKVVKKFYLGKVSAACLIFLIWTSFSTCFSTSAMTDLSTPSILLTVFLNIALYLFLTALCFGLCHIPGALRPRTTTTTTPTPTEPLPATTSPRNPLLHTVLTHLTTPIPATETIAICFCGPAKTTGLGIPLIYAMYRIDGDPEALARTARTSVPVILYTTEQIFCAHLMVRLFRWWVGRVDGVGGGCGGEGEGVVVQSEMREISPTSTQIERGRAAHVS